jgi:Transglutaminase-like superfamily
MVAPSDFEAQGYSGNMSTWENYGKFIYQLKKGRDALPDETKKQVHTLTDNLKDPKEKIKVLYDFLQKNTHYISIQLGLGGWQPFDASYVATKKYGDCKALSNYMVSLLKEAGIAGKYIEIRAENNAQPIVKDFSESQFNHVICCVPLQRDTVWLECTSENLPAGYLSGFTEDRWGLLVDENGGTLVHTPKYGYKENVEQRNIKGSINDEGNLKAGVETIYKAMQQDDLSSVLNSYSDDKAAEYLKKSIDLPTYDIKNLHFAQDKNLLPCISAKFDLAATNYAQVTGKRLFINPNILTKSNDRPTEDEERKYDVELHNEETDIDTVEIQIPPGYTVESPFHDINIESKFGKFNASAKVTPGKIIYYRRQEYYSGRFPPADYASLVNYYQQVYKADHSKIVLVKQE